MRALTQDFLLSVRSLRREPASAVIASVTLGLGIGLCTIAFSLLFGVFLRGHPVPEANRLLLINRSNPSRDIEFMSARSSKGSIAACAPRRISSIVRTIFRR